MSKRTTSHRGPAIRAPALAILLAGLLIAVRADASIVLATGGGVAAGSAAGVDLRPGMTEHNNGVWGFDERQGVAIAAGSIAVDFLVGVNLNVGDAKAGISNPISSIVLPTGTYDSHVLHFDPQGAAGSVANDVFTFGSDIVAIIVSNSAGSAVGALLNASDAAFGFADTSYDSGLGRRLENADSIALVASNVLSVVLVATAGGNIDELRVLTRAATVPEPASWVLLAVGLIGAGHVRRRARLAHAA